MTAAQLVRSAIARCFRLAAFSALPVLLLSAAVAQLPAGTSDASSSSSTAAPIDPSDSRLRTEAAAALERNDFAAALKSLSALAQLHPTDARILFDLGSTQDALDQISPAEASYRRSIAADPAYLQPHLGLGLLLARNHQEAEARKELSSAAGMTTGEPELRARAERALAQLDRVSDPAAARDALLAALKLTPETPDDLLLSGSLAEQASDPVGAQAAYRRLLARQPNDPAATTALARLLLGEGKLPEAQAALSSALAAHPGDPLLSAQLASVDVRQGDAAAALALIAPLHQAHPEDAGLARLDAHLLAQTGDYAAAEPLLSALHRASPDDAELADDNADALIHLKRFVEAESILKAAVAQPNTFRTREDLADAAGHLAFAASQNNDSETVLQAASLRATVLPRSPAILFLEAIARDKLHQKVEAEALYRQFLSASNGKFPDEEWEARHRLLALQHTR